VPIRNYYSGDIYCMNKQINKIVGVIESYLKGVDEVNPTPKEIELNITKLLEEHDLVSDFFTIEVIPLNGSYMLRARNQYTSIILGAMPSFCKIFGKRLGKTPCQHEQ
jgi:hypothetical protein